MYKNYSIPLGEMSFFKDFVSDTKGDLYPIVEKSEDCHEAVINNLYTVKRGSVTRFVCQYFPYATYELSADIKCGKVGFEFRLPIVQAKITISGGVLEFVSGEHRETVDARIVSDTMAVSCRPGFFDVYFKVNGKLEHIHTFEAEGFKSANLETEFTDGAACLTVSGDVTVKCVNSYIDCGVSVADMRPVKYENGDVLYEDGKVYFTASARLHEGNYQLIFSWIPGTEQFTLTGVLFFDSGDGRWNPYIASSLLYHRGKKEWYIWTSSFECGHILACGHFGGDPRFGVNVCDVKIMEETKDGTDIREFAGFVRDEDPDFYFDEEIGKWRMAICRIDPKTKKYVYVFFESDDPFTGYKHIGTALDGCETGGSFVKVDGERFFVCGNDFARTSEYRIYSKDGMTTAKFDYPDGGFRGWGSIIPVKMCGRMRYFWLTFDRHKGSDYNWSYGNLYCFEVR